MTPGALCAKLVTGFIEELSDPACAAAVEKVRNDWKGMQK